MNTQTDDSELFEPSAINEDELIAQLLMEDEQEESTNAEQLPVPEQQEITENPVDENQSAIAAEKSTKFPLSRIKAIMKMDPDVNITSGEAVFLISRATELFLKHLAQETYTFTAKAKRKTVQRRDLDAAIENNDALCFLEGALD